MVAPGPFALQSLQMRLPSLSGDGTLPCSKTRLQIVQ